MAIENVALNTQHGVERIFIRLTKAQKKIIHELRENKDLFIIKEKNEYKLYENSELIKLLNAPTVEKLLKVKFLTYSDLNSNKIRLATKAR